VAAVLRHLVEEGRPAPTEAVALVGSWARGDQREHSDVDLIIVGDEQPPLLRWIDGRFVSITYRSADVVRDDFTNPGLAGLAVPAWRDAAILVDPAAVAARLVRDAHDWTWADVGDERCDRWVASRITGYAEEALKVAAALTARRPVLAAVERNVMAIQLAPIVGVHLRLVYQTENDLWDQVAERVGGQWARAQHAALATQGESLTVSAAAALQLYALAVDIVRPVLGEADREVVDAVIAGL
jgi:predicted nucleotidyltransferase